MKVRDLINALNTVDPELDVMITTDGRPESKIGAIYVNPNTCKDKITLTIDSEYLCRYDDNFEDYNIVYTELDEEAV
jgi:hypothetical protein